MPSRVSKLSCTWLKYYDCAAVKHNYATRKLLIVVLTRQVPIYFVCDRWCRVIILVCSVPESVEVICPPVHVYNRSGWTTYTGGHITPYIV